MLLPRRLAQEVSGGQHEPLWVPQHQTSRERLELDRARGSGQGTRGLSKIPKQDGPAGTWRGAQQRGGGLEKKESEPRKPEPSSPASPAVLWWGALPGGRASGLGEREQPQFPVGASGPGGRGAESPEGVRPMTGEVSQLPTQLRWQHLPRFLGTPRRRSLLLSEGPRSEGRTFPHVPPRSPAFPHVPPRSPAFPRVPPRSRLRNEQGQGRPLT